MNINREILRLVQYGIQHELLDENDKVYTINQLLSVLKLVDFQYVEIEEEKLDTPTPILENMLEWAYKNGVLESNTPVYRDLLDTKIMACLMPRPSEIINTFKKLYAEDNQKATDYYYKLSSSSDYVRRDRIAKDEVWKSDTEIGILDITINLSKPEKDPKAIAAAKTAVSSTYPLCLLCKENEGYEGRINHPARGNHRIIPIELNSEKWFLQYSPYSYYNEHCIVLKDKHEPMKISKETFIRLLDFVEIFPHYFIGSNADLPIVGGSILSHDHFQGGNYEFAMAKAPVYKKFIAEQYKDLEIGLVDWPMSVIRLRGLDKYRIVEFADKVLHTWRNYSDESVDILAYSGETPHNTITPIARVRNGQYELDLVLRNNRTTDEHPDGMFHPHKDIHHIKKENIGLIEVMGLAVLPARLKEELTKIEYYLSNPDREKDIFADEEMDKHIDWYNYLKELNFDTNNVKEMLNNEVAKKFARCLQDAGVFKNDEEGRRAFEVYVDSLIK